MEESVKTCSPLHFKELGHIGESGEKDNTDVVLCVCTALFLIERMSKWMNEPVGW